MWDLVYKLKDHIEAVLGFITIGYSIWRWAVRPTMAILRRVEQAVINVENNIGTNGGSTVFNQFESIKDTLQVTASLADVIDRPSIFFGPTGEVESINNAFTECTGWSIERLRRGGWRQLFNRDDLDYWDDTVERQAVFAHTAWLGGKSFYITAKPIFNGARFLGWRAVMTPTVKTP
jgi:hypothetical protein